MTIGTPRRRAGFTLIELLVVIAIIAVLIALLLPAVQAAREAARRAHCLNNLVQVSVALQNYEASHEVLPPGVVNPSGPVADAAKGYQIGWMVQILPFIEQGNTFRKLNFSAGAYGPANDTIRSHGISVFDCPSDGGPRSSTNEAGLVVNGNNYAACHNDVEAPIDARNTGVFYLNSSTRYEDITDGSSFTIFVGEKNRESNELGWVSGTRSTLRNTGWPPNNKSLFSAGMPSGPGAFNGPDEEPAPAPGPGQPDPALVVGGFSSKHAGGSNFMFGDGSVRFIKNSISPPVFHRLGNRADGEMVSDDQF